MSPTLPATSGPLGTLHVATPEQLARVLRDSLRADGSLSAASRPIVLRLDGRLLARRGRVTPSRS